MLETPAKSSAPSAATTSTTLEAVVAAVLQGRDCLVPMPAGGKSLSCQIPGWRNRALAWSSRS